MDAANSKSAKGKEKLSASQKLNYSRSDNDRFLFMFVRRRDCRYLLYKLDALHYLENEIVEEPALLPLIVFTRQSLPDCNCAFAFIDPNFYIIGVKADEVFTLNKHQLLKLDPSEKTRGGEFVKRITTPMLTNKLEPMAFTYNDKLYVMSRDHYPLLYGIGKICYDFEVYSPLEKSWKNLGNKPMREICIRSHLVLKGKVYFTTSDQVVLSFDLEAERWGSIFDPYGTLVRCPEYCMRPRPNFDTQIQLIGNTVFGGFYRYGLGYYDICASSALNPNEDLFLRPSLVHDKDFYDHIYSVCCQERSLCSKNIVIIDGKMCVVCYGNDPWDKVSNYVVLNFFKVTDDSYKSDIPQVEDKIGAPLPFRWNSMFFYASDEDGKHVNFFESSFISSTFFSIDTKKQATPGVLYSCMFV